RKRRRGAADSGQARKRSRLLPSSAGGTLQTELIDLEESEVIDLTGESSEPEVITLSDDESAVVKVHGGKQSQQYPLGSRAAETEAELLASKNEEEPRDIDRYVRKKMSLSILISD
ncbi:RNF4 ligase, partial [Ptilonorhynchus violaceus]|nr:RNF4 ligase [Ptilonorhynchus violaceus]